jgi:EmrB/QacA subfamily drug resistance transporter
MTNIRTPQGHSGQRSGPQTGHPQRVKILVVMCVCLGTVLSAVSSLNVALPVLARATGATQTEMQWIIDAYALVFAALLLPAGALGDRFGRRRMLLTGLVIFGAAAAAAMTVSDPSYLILTRGALGVGAALVMPATLSIITTTHPPEERASAVSVWAGVAGGSAILGLLVAGTLLEFFSWQSVFGLNVVLAVISIAATLILVPESADPDEAMLDPIGAALSIAGLVAIVYAVIEGPDRGWTNGLTLGCFVGGAIAIVAFVTWELHHSNPMLDPRLFTRDRFSAGTLSISLQFFTFFGFIFLFLQYLQLVRGYRPIIAACAMIPTAVCLVITAKRAPHLVERFGVRRMAPIGMLIMAVGFAVLALIDTSSSYWFTLIGLIALGVGMGIATTPATEAIVSSLPDEKQGVGSAMNDVAREVGGTLGIAVLGSILNASYQSEVANDTHALPVPLAQTAKESLGLAMNVFSTNPQLAHLIPMAQQSFMDGFSRALWAASAILVVTAAALAGLLRRTTDADHSSSHAVLD